MSKIQFIQLNHSENNTNTHRMELKVKILIGVGIITAIIVMFIGVDALMCKPPCI